MLLGIKARALHRLSPTALAVDVDLKTNKQNNPGLMDQVLPIPALPEANAEGSSLLGQPRLQSETCLKFEEQKRKLGL